MQYEYWVIGAAVLALAYAAWQARLIAVKQVTDKKAGEIAQAIREGAMAFLAREYRVLAIVVVIVAFLMWLTRFVGSTEQTIAPQTIMAFIIGAVLSVAAGNMGMRIATLANVRTAEAVKKSMGNGLAVAFSSGAVMGMTVVGLGLLGVTLLWLWFGNPTLIYGFGFGASAVALFARVGGGIYTKAADVGADLVGKIEQNIPEDDPRNPAVIADNVGDNVGDVAGMGADLFESYVDTLIAAMVLGLVALPTFGSYGVIYPLGLAAIGIIASLVGVNAVRTNDESKISSSFNRGIFLAGGLMVVGSWFWTNYLFRALPLFWTVVTGLVAGIIIGLVTEYYTSHDKAPTRQVAHAAKTGAATNIISGLSLGMFSTAVPVLVVAAAILISYWLAGIYGIAIAAVGMLSTLGITLASDTYGPVADNAAGIAEMAGMGEETRKRAESLDAVGNTTAAIGKGFAIGSAALTALALLVSYITVAKIGSVDVIHPKVMVGLFIGGALPFLFSAFSMQAVGKSAMKMVEEVRRQFKEIPGLMAGTAKPDYKRSVDIATTAALHEMVLPGILVIAVPIVVGFTLGAEALGGLLAGSIVTGFLLAVMMANAGGAWDNAKKYIEAGNLGGKGSDTHKAAVIGDTVGDPFKDTSGPSLNILIKLMSIVALIIAPLL
ncbi:MAG: sodium-translocating pyrophosphatase [Candidatus Andersenbacteria bacterium]|nr:sodium-translocating pyrophosphatase [bacterium]MDZ4225571.1 sodium-translocating pyrophosphatase [Candidatus Andersenbacteria bacterium]